ncbi:MAG: ABC transporter permease [Lacipirellulaceae bacterium]
MTTRLVREVAMVGLRRMTHARAELLLTFLVPILFFTIFAWIFDNGVGSGRSKRIKLAVTNLDSGDAAKQLAEKIKGSDAIRLIDAGATPSPDPLDAARDRVLRGDASVAIVVPEGWSATLDTSEPGKVFLLADSSDQVSPKLAAALVQEAIGATFAERASAGRPLPPGAPAPQQPSLSASSPLSAPSAVEVIDVLGESKANPVVSMYAAGIAVMFLLFSATGAAGALLEEEENQTLERLLASRLTMTHVLLGKWLSIALVGFVQIAVMFAWAQVAFGVDVVKKLDGFVPMTLATAAAASALALALAAACRSRAQLNAVSVVLVLSMSALGGSMVPRYLMSDSMQQLGRVTFNAWAIDGYTKLFWRDLPATELWPELAFMAAATVVLLLIARLFALRWERD